MSYYIKESLLYPEDSENNRVLYKIVEKNTELEIYETVSYDKTRNMCRSLNLGSGFHGWTPSFFTIKYPTPSD